jgi:hypothetical protein
MKKTLFMTLAALMTAGMSLAQQPLASNQEWTSPDGRLLV